MYTVLVSSRIQILDIAAVGGIIGFCITLILLIVLICYRTVRPHAVLSDSPTMYWLVVVYLSSALIICFLTGFVRSNMVFGTSVESYHDECNIGYIGSLIFQTANRGALYLIFLQKMKGLFQFDHIYYLFFYWCISMLVALNWSLFVLSNDSSSWLLIVDPSKSSIFCVRDSDDSSEGLYVAKLLLAVMEVILFRLYVLFEFAKGMYAAQKRLKSVDEDDVNMDTIQFHNLLVHLQRTKNQIQKCLIMTTFSVMASMTFWLCTAVVRDGSTWVCWEMIANALCVVLLLDGDGFSQSFACCSKYGCCCLCYLDQHVHQFMVRSIGLDEHEKNVQYYS